MQPEPGYVYVMALRQNGNLEFKIGKSKHPEKRLKEIKGGKPIDLQLWVTVEVDDMDAIETMLHEQFAAQRIPGTREWFTLKQGDLMSFSTMGGVYHVDTLRRADYWYMVNDCNWLYNEGSYCPVIRATKNHITQDVIELIEQLTLKQVSVARWVNEAYAH